MLVFYSVKILNLFLQTTKYEEIVIYLNVRNIMSDNNLITDKASIIYSKSHI